MVYSAPLDAQMQHFETDVVALINLRAPPPSVRRVYPRQGSHKCHLTCETSSFSGWFYVSWSLNLILLPAQLGLYLIFMSMKISNRLDLIKGKLSQPRSLSYPNPAGRLPVLG